MALPPLVCWVLESLQPSTLDPHHLLTCAFRTRIPSVTHENARVLHASHPPKRTIDGVTRYALIFLGVLILAGIVLSLLPNPPRAPLGEVTLEGVDFELYPAADLDAKWTFKASKVVYNPETRESIADLQGDGQRLVKGKVDLFLRTPQVKIDSEDNLSTQEAKIFVPNGCYALTLGQPVGSAVVINQNSGYSAPYSKIDSPGFSQEGNNFTSNFEITNYGIDARSTQIRDGDKEIPCAKVKSQIGFQ